MHIERIQVEEGFLDGLDLRLVPGLVTIIGARGTGKTSLIELIRFCLDVPGYTPESGRRSRDHAISVLGSGQVTLAIKDGSRDVSITRTADEARPRATGAIPTPIIFSQTEIENVAMQPGGRLRLIDSFTANRTIFDQEENAAILEVRSLTLEVAALRREVEELQTRQAELPNIEAALAALAPEEARFSALSEATGKKTEALAEVTAKTSMNGVLLEALSQYVLSARKSAERMRDALHRAATGPREIAVVAYSYLIRQLKYDSTDGTLALKMLTGVRRMYEGT